MYSCIHILFYVLPSNHARPKFDKSSSVFKRLGPAKSSPDGSGGSVFSRMSGGGGGGGSHGISRWHKVTVSGRLIHSMWCFMIHCVPALRAVRFLVEVLKTQTGSFASSRKK